MSTPTPRTDAKLKSIYGYLPDNTCELDEFARQLERELAEAKARAEKAEAELASEKAYNRLRDSEHAALTLKCCELERRHTEVAVAIGESGEWLRKANIRVRELEQQLAGVREDYAVAKETRTVMDEWLGAYKRNSTFLRAQLARKDEALKPFASEASRFNESDKDSDQLRMSFDMPDGKRYSVLSDMTVGDLRRAAAALATGGKESAR